MSLTFSEYAKTQSKRLSKQEAANKKYVAAFRRARKRDNWEDVLPFLMSEADRRKRGIKWLPDKEYNDERFGYYADYLKIIGDDFYETFKGMFK